MPSTLDLALRQRACFANIFSKLAISRNAAAYRRDGVRPLPTRAAFAPRSRCAVFSGKT